MNPKRAKIASLIASCQGRGLDAHYLAFFECFNRQLFFEAHEVLEALWLTERKGPRNLFYKGLIQLAGAFVHVQKGRWAPAAALLRLAQRNLERYPARFEHLDLSAALKVTTEWLARLEASPAPSSAFEPSQLPRLLPPSGG